MITLAGLLQVIKSTKVITVNLFDEEGLLLISFGLPGYSALEDTLENAEVLEVDIVNLVTFNIKINTSNN